MSLRDSSMLSGQLGSGPTMSGQAFVHLDQRDRFSVKVTYASTVNG